ncbi:MAG TPA: sigma-54 dependent transcriptional regulator [Acidobacteriota bacterium]|jgi:DNA-binding NtrC family response regulator
MAEKMEKDRILIADDDSSSRESLRELVNSWGYEARAVANGAEALKIVNDYQPSLLITDLVMPQLDGIGLLRAVKDRLQTMPVVLLTAHGTIPTAIDAMKEGAVDYITKPLDFQKLKELIEHCLSETKPFREARALVGDKADKRFEKLIGSSRHMQDIYYQIKQVATNPVSVMISGESGTGKELVARTIHNLSDRRDQPFIAINASAIPDTLVESEIFGHERGAFTDAKSQRQGCFELANGGTLLLDEIAEMPMHLQPKLLRLLEERKLRRLGGSAEIEVDVRVIAATNIDPKEAVQKQKLREDLYYRLNVFSIEIPPLRDRREDIPLLVDDFTRSLASYYGKKVKAVDRAALKLLACYDWPGNVRELRNVIERAIILCNGDSISVSHLPSHLQNVDMGPPRGISLPVGITIAQAEKWLIQKTLQETGYSKTRAAQILGISERTLYNKLKSYKLEENAKQTPDSETGT